MSHDNRLFPVALGSGAVGRKAASVRSETDHLMPVSLCFCKQEVIFFCVREEPVVFLHKDDDFVPYTPRRKENLHENLHGLKKEVLVEGLELTVRKEVTEARSLAICVFVWYHTNECI